MDLLYSFLKVTSMIATGLFGALGLLTKYKDDQGKITKWGKVALGGILLSSGFSLGLYILETSRAKAAADKAKAEANATAQVLQTILTNAQTTAEQQRKGLEEINLLKADLTKTLEQQQANLKRTDEVAEGMRTSIVAQQAVLGGNKRILAGLSSSVVKLDDLASNLTRTNNELIVTREGLTEQISINLMTALAKAERIERGNFTLAVTGSANNAADQASYLFSDVFKQYGTSVIGEIHINFGLGGRSFQFRTDQAGRFIKEIFLQKDKPGPEKPIELPKELPVKESPIPSLSTGKYERVSHVTFPFENIEYKRNPALAFRDLKKGSRIGSMSLKFSRSISRLELERTLNYWLENFNLGNVYLPIDKESSLAISASINIGEHQITSDGIIIKWMVANDPKLYLASVRG